MHPLDAQAWRTLAHTSPAQLWQRQQLALSLLQQRFDRLNPDVLAVVRALEGATLEELVAGQVGG
jgi:hypothetical protein